MDIVPIIIFLVLPSYWVYLHLSFRATLKKEDPSLFRNYKEWSPLKYSSGFAWVELVLTNKHLSSLSVNVVNSGNRLCRAYELKFKVIGVLLVISVLWVALSFTIISFGRST